jgi:predicted acyltransferase (DUF342 family)
MKKTIIIILIILILGLTLGFAYNNALLRGNTIFILTALLYLALFTLPLIGAFYELFKPQDDKPLFINQGFTKDPFYFYKSFQNLLCKNLENHSKAFDKVEVFLSKKETIEIATNLKACKKSVSENLLWDKGSLSTKENCVFLKEVFVSQNAEIAENNTFRALAVQGTANIADGVHIKRWFSSEGDITIGKNGKLGISLSSKKTITLSQNCEFKSIYATEIITRPDKSHGNIEKLFSERLDKLNLSDKKNILDIEADSLIQDNLITIKNLVISKKDIFKKSIKGHQTVLLKEGVKVSGNIFSEGDIIIGPNCEISGNIFAQGEIIISRGCVIGQKGKIKSLIAKKQILLDSNVKIYGHINTHGKGLAL